MARSPPASLELSLGTGKCLWAIPWHEVDADAYGDVVPPSSRVGALLIFEKYACTDRSTVEFLATVGDAVSRPAFVHEYTITEQSLFAAVSVGFTGDAIVATLERLCHTALDPFIMRFVHRVAATYGQAALVLRGDTYWVMAHDRAVITRLARALGDMIDASDTYIDENGVRQYIRPAAEAWGVKAAPARGLGDAADTAFADVAGADVVAADALVMRVGADVVAAARIDELRVRARDAGLPLTEEYAFALDTQLPTLQVGGADGGKRTRMRPKPSTAVRPYQDRALYRVFGSGRAQSGIVVLPCGAGKTLVGVMAAVTVGKPVVIVCTNETSSWQWAEEFKQWTNAGPDDVFLFGRSNTAPAPWAERMVPPGTTRGGISAPGVLVSTFAMLGWEPGQNILARRTASHQPTRNEAIRNWVRGHAWGLLLIDEVHVASATMFSRVCKRDVRAHCRIGLTATLVREDAGIPALHAIVGPRLYEADWLELRDRGYLSNVLVSEVRCPMDPAFFRDYLEIRSSGGAAAAAAGVAGLDEEPAAPTAGSTKTPDSRRRQLAILNPGKLAVAEYLVRHHMSRGDKILVFCDDIAPLKTLALFLKIDFVFGHTGESTRRRIFERFRNARGGSAIAVSKIADNSLNLPEANVIVQVASQGGSRRQEAQRLGRILRPKVNPTVRDDLGRLNQDAPRVAAIMNSRRAGVRFMGGLEGDAPPVSAYFYSLISNGTEEETFSLRRRQFLINQGYAITVCTDLYDRAAREARDGEGKTFWSSLFDDTAAAIRWREQLEKLRARIKTGTLGDEDALHEGRWASERRGGL